MSAHSRPLAIGSRFQLSGYRSSVETASDHRSSPTSGQRSVRTAVLNRTLPGDGDCAVGPSAFDIQHFAGS